MNPRVIQVTSIANYLLDLTFDNGEVREFDVSPYHNKGIFKALSDKDYFEQVRVTMGTVDWPDGQDFCPDTLYEDSIALIADNGKR